MLTKTHLKGIATLVGTVIGAGILGIPYIVAKAGFLTGAVVIIILGLAIMLLNLCLGEITLRTKGEHQLVAYAEMYLGKIGKFLMAISMIVGIYGAMLAYTIGVGSSLAQIFGLSQTVWSLIFFAVFALLIHFGLGVFANSELLMEIVKALLFAFVFLMIIFSNKMNFQNLTSFDISKILLPYGVVLFAFLGTVAIPEIREELRNNLRYMKKVVILGSLIPIIIYLLFAFAVVGITGNTTTEVATIGIGQTFGPLMMIMANLFAVLAMATSFLALGFGIKEMYYHDYKLSKNMSWVLTFIVPLILFLAGFKSFINSIEIAGVISGSIVGVAVILMFWNAKKIGNRKPEYVFNMMKVLGIFLMLIFLFGAAHYVWSLF